jgi:dimethylargininase
MRWIALTRDVGESIARCELTHLERHPIDVDRARAQHAAYEAALRGLGCRVERVEAAPDCPDSVFIEDTAVVFPELAVITRPGATSRRGETEAVAQALAPYRHTVAIQSPGTLDGGDVLVAGRTVFVGQSTRTNGQGIEQMRQAVSTLGYTVIGIPVTGCLHLKSAVTEVAERVLLLQPRWVDPALFDGFDKIEVDSDDLYGANALRIGNRVIYPTAFPKTAARLAARGISLHLVGADELAKAEGAATCCSLVFEA